MYFGHWMKIISAKGYSTSETIIQNWWDDKNLPQYAETETIYEHQATTTEHSRRILHTEDESK
jgi:hypothetical protein